MSSSRVVITCHALSDYLHQLHIYDIEIFSYFICRSIFHTLVLSCPFTLALLLFTASLNNYLPFETIRWGRYSNSLRRNNYRDSKSNINAIFLIVRLYLCKYYIAVDIKWLHLFYAYYIDIKYVHMLNVYHWYSSNLRALNYKIFHRRYNLQIHYIIISNFNIS